MNTKRKINIISVDNGYGLSRDATTLADILRDEGFKVFIQTIGKNSLGYKFQRLNNYASKAISYTLAKKPRYDINIFLEYVIPEWFSYAAINCLIPNQEWFREAWKPHLKDFDLVLCKSRFAEGIFKSLGCKTTYISFTTRDRFNSSIPKNFQGFFHLTGKWPHQRGTQKLIEVWSKHPEWPRLTVRQKKQKFHAEAANIYYINEFLKDDSLRTVQNSQAIHLCPSISEGFGHCIVEAMSCKSIVLTTDAPPMNELVTQDRGFLVGFTKSKCQRLGTNFYVEIQDLEESVDTVLGTDSLTKQKLADNAREWYLENDSFFKENLIQIMKNL